MSLTLASLAALAFTFGGVFMKQADGLSRLAPVAGFIVLFADSIWVIYRIVKGILNWNDGKPMPVKA